MIIIINLLPAYFLNSIGINKVNAHCIQYGETLQGHWNGNIHEAEYVWHIFLENGCVIPVNHGSIATPPVQYRYDIVLGRISSSNMQNVAYRINNIKRVVWFVWLCSCGRVVVMLNISIPNSKLC